MYRIPNLILMMYNRNIADICRKSILLRNSLVNRYYIVLIIFFLCTNIQAQQRKPYENIRTEAGKIASHPGMKHAAWSFAVLDAGTGQIVCQVNPDLGLVPASIIKLAVTYPAWITLGPDFRFKTCLQIDGKVSDSLLKGNVYIKGDGDPTLGSLRIDACHPDSLFLRWENILHRTGIKEIEGGVIADADVFADDIIPGEWLWNDIGNYYGSGASGLNFRENSLDFIFDPGEHEGLPARLTRMDPLLHGLDLDNQVITGKKVSGDQVIIYGAPFSSSRLLRGTVPIAENDFIVRGSFPDPALATAQLFEQYLKGSDLIVMQEATSTRLLRNRGIRISQARTTLDTVFSPSLSGIIQYIHHKSVNTYAEALVKKLGEKEKNTGSTAAGLEFILQFWKLHGLDVKGMSLYDGCGLSPLNHISAMQMAGMMRIMVNEKGNEEFLKTLSIAGNSGDMKAILTVAPARGNLIGKSGYMKNVRSYCGTVRNRSGKTLVFAVIVNNYEGDSPSLRRMLEDLMQEIARSKE